MTNRSARQRNAASCGVRCGYMSCSTVSYSINERGTQRQKKNELTRQSRTNWSFDDA